MSTFKTIAWENWNVLEEEQIENDIAEELLNSTPEPEEDEDITELNPLMFFGNRQIYTPLGSYSADTPLKPSNRWDCWIGHTNFEITLYNILGESVMQLKRCNGTQHINVDSFTKGTYIIHIRDENKELITSEKISIL